EGQGQLARRVAAAVRGIRSESAALYPVEIEIDNETSPQHTVLHLRSEDTVGFLYELSNALTLCKVDIVRVMISSSGKQVYDTLFVTDTSGRKISDPERQRELRSAVVLIKHFTHLLPQTPNPESA